MAESGIYEIVNLVNGKRYVGSTAGFTRRWQDHRSYLARGAHHCTALQRAWLKYGETAFEFCIVERCGKGELIEREQSVIDRLKPEYNACPLADSSRGVRHTPEARANMSAAQKRRFTQPEVRAAHLEMVRRPEHRAKSSAIHRGNAYTRGKKRPTEFGAKISAAISGTKHCQTDWTIYTLRHADGREVSGIQINLRQVTGMSGPEMSRLLKGGRPTAKGWRLAVT